ncbi:MAG: MerR family transcriptional regulator [Selenomonadaceae bacterium]|nr:MerR family transcriptional regulator [Selenomonadaceae bacterium]
MDIDNKKSAGGKVQNEHQTTAKSVEDVSTPFPPHFLPPTSSKSGVNALAGYFTTEQVAKSIDVTRKTVEYWRKRGWFRADLVDHNGVYWYTAEHVEQLKAVYRRDWQKAWTGAAAPDSEKKSVPELFAEVEKRKTDWKSRAEPTKLIAMTDYFAHQLKIDIELLKNYAERKTGFENIDEHQFFSPGLYVVGATPAAGKTTFCWQLLEQLAEYGESCIYCSYEMSGLELFTKTAARKLFLKDKTNSLTAADIRRGSWSSQLDCVINEVANSQSNLQIMELQDESIEELLSQLKSHCSDKAKAPVVCLDYLQIVPSSRESAKLGIDDSVRKLKKFQRDTNTTFIVISSFNRTNYTQSVSFESFKESGNIEYTADVVWALQLYVLNSINPSNIGDSRKKIDESKKKQPRQIQLKCLKNRQGTNYDCYFNYYSAHDYFEPCEQFSENKRTSSESKQ